MPVSRRAFTIYVIRLRKSVLLDHRFRERNSHHVPGKPCVYVGMTYLSADERFQQHKAGIHAARIAHRFGKSLVKSECRRTKPITHARALTREAKLADALRKRGWGVWQN